MTPGADSETPEGLLEGSLKGSPSAWGDLRSPPPKVRWKDEHKAGGVPGRAPSRWAALDGGAPYGGPSPKGGPPNGGSKIPPDWGRPSIQQQKKLEGLPPLRGGAIKLGGGSSIPPWEPNGTSV